MPTNADRHLRVSLAAVITAAWAVSFVADLLIPEYDPPSSGGALMLLVAGALFGEGVVRQVKKTEDSNE